MLIQSLRNNFLYIPRSQLLQFLHILFHRTLTNEELHLIKLPCLNTRHHKRLPHQLTKQETLPHSQLAVSWSVTMCEVPPTVEWRQGHGVSLARTFRL